MTEFYNKHYIRCREDGAITEGWSDGPHNHREVTEDDILINDRGGYQFRLCPAGVENPPLYTEDGIPLYRWTGAEAVTRTEAEIEADRAELPAPEPTELEKLRADVDFLMIMEDLA